MLLSFDRIVLGLNESSRSDDFFFSLVR